MNNIHLIDEKSVLLFYIEQLNNNNVKFLENKQGEKNYLEEKIRLLIDSSSIHEKIELAKEIWKFLMKYALSYMDPDRRGYDRLFDYFDEFIKFEELIFASDSFYRDHTLHCLWVYFLTEYLFKKNEFDILFTELRAKTDFYAAMLNLFKSIDEPDIFGYITKIFENLVISTDHQDSVRCVAALTHDLGYPLTKINKINKAIGKILPYFSLMKFNAFDFHYDIIQQIWIQQFIAQHMNQIAEVSLPLVAHTTPECWIQDFGLKISTREWVASPMGRVMIVEELSSMKVGNGRFKAKIIDEQCEWNNGKFVFQSLNGLLSVEKTREEEDCVMTIQGLSAIIYGGHELEDLVIKGLIIANKDTLKVIERLFPQAYPHLHEDF